MDKEIQLTPDDFRIRCSAINDISAGVIGMSKAEKRKIEEFREKIKKHEEAGKGGKLTELQQKDYNALLIKEKEKPALPEGAKTYVRNWVKENIIYKRRKLMSNKYTRKGQENEEQGRELVSKYLKLGLLFDANEDGRKYSEYIEGVCDVELERFLIDIKNSYTFDTFPIFSSVCKEEYVKQMKGYLHLYNKPFGIVAFVLTDFSDDDIDKECERQARALGLMEVNKELYDKVKADMTYSDLDDRLRVRLFRIDADPEFIEDIEMRVRMCRDYAKEVIQEFKDMMKLQPSLIEEKK